MKTIYFLSHGPTNFSMSLCDGPFEKQSLARQAIKQETNYHCWQLVRIGKEATVIDSSTLVREREAIACKAAYERAIADYRKRVTA